MVSPHSVRTGFMGTAQFAVPSLEALVREGYSLLGVVSQPPRPAGRSRKMTAPPLMEAAERLGLPVLTPERLRAPDSVAALANLRPDLIVVAAYGQILPRTVLDLPPKGCLNVHGSLLPRWRGASPIQAAILAGDEATGVTIMQMDPGMDTGPILARKATPILEEDSAPELEMRLSRMGAELLIESLPGYLEGSLLPVPQDERLATYAPIIRKEDGLIDWSRRAVEIWRASRAYRPWPGSYTFWKGRMLKVISCRPEGASSSTDAPGTVVPLGANGEVGVVTGGGLLRLLEVALEGGRPLPIRDFLLGHREFVGSRLG